MGHVQKASLLNFRDIASLPLVDWLLRSGMAALPADSETMRFATPVGSSHYSLETD